MLGQLMKYFGEDRIVFGSDCVFNGSPQWQIEALWRFQIPEEMRRRFGYPELTATAKRKILGLNSARLYKLPAQGLVGGDGSRRYKPLPRDYENRISVPLKALLEYPGLPQDKLALRPARVPGVGGDAEPHALRLGAPGLSRHPARRGYGGLQMRRRAAPVLRAGSVSADCLVQGGARESAPCTSALAAAVCPSWSGR